MTRIAELNVIANMFGWKNINVNVETRLVSYAKMVDFSPIRMDVYYTTMTVTVSLEHPKKGKTQLHRRNVSDDELKILFQNPRAHTGKGYYKKY
ncbi:MAG: hypothetical protein GX567_09530 [Clostridia bacterium]|nr:hypothetical protein [Clostridia bacterium]